MEFQTQTAIWLQIAHQIAARILAREWPPGDRIPSVRDLAAEIQVNPNTVARSVTYLQDEGLIVNQRGIGYFVAEDGPQKARAMQREVFQQELMPVFFRAIDQLQIGWDELKQLHQQFKQQA